MEENREALGKDMDIENLASVLSDSDGGGAGKEVTLDPVDIEAAPIPVPEPDVPTEVTPVSAAEDSIEPPAPEITGVSESESLSSAPEAADADPATPDGGLSAPASAEPESPAADSDIDALIKKYEDIPAGKKEIEKKSKSGGGKGKSLPLAPIAAAAGVVIVLALLKFVVFKPARPGALSAPPAKKVQASQGAAKAASPKPGSSAALAGAVPAGVDYPGGAVLLGETKDGIAIKIFETAAVARDIKLFYQKKMTEKGFELSTSRKNRSTFNMNFFKDSAGYSVSVVPHAGKNLIIVTHAK